MTLTHNLQRYCEACGQELPRVASLATRLSHLNVRLHAAGLIYWNTITAAMNNVEMALEANGFALPEGWAYTLHESTARVHAEVGDGKWLTLSLYRTESGRYEVTAYVN